jgi:tRNA A-37 threonylcarbamoyl transferase component Bud32
MVQSRLPSRYRVIEEVGQGGMAVVYRAEDETLRREVAIKVLHPHLLAEPESKARLEREAQAVAKLQHDNILQVFDYSGEDAPASYIVTEFIDGQTLKQFFTGRKTPQPEIAALIAIELGSALAHAHAFGIIHRDVKPENVMVRRDGMLKLMDFGVAQILDLERMTVTGQLLGSPAYMAPELFEGKPLDFRTDVFSVGIMLYQMATGSLPFSGRNPHEVLKKIAEGRFPDPRTLNRLIADRLTRIISRALAKKPDDRYATIAAFVDDLRVYVGDAGLRDAREELHGFFTDPEGYERELRQRSVAALVQSGRREQAAGKLARALECWNRALTLDPRNSDVLRALHRIEGRRRIYRTAVALGGAALLAGLIWGAFKMAHTPVPAPIAVLGGPRVEQARAAAARPAATAPAAAGQARHTKKDPAPQPKVAGRPAPPKPPITRPVTSEAMHQEDRSAATKPKVKVYNLAPTPQYVDVYLDGQKAMTFDVGHSTLPVPLDGREHIVEFRNDCCDPYPIPVGPNRPHYAGDTLIARLKPKIARVRVTVTPIQSTPPQVEIVEQPETPTSTHLPGIVGEEYPIPFDANGSFRKELQISVYVDGRTVPARKTVEIRPGDSKKVEIQLGE